VQAEAALEPGNAAKYLMKIPCTNDITAAKVGGIPADMYSVHAAEQHKTMSHCFLQGAWGELGENRKGWDAYEAVGQHLYLICNEDDVLSNTPGNTQ
jgi:hypothetical protein